MDAETKDLNRDEPNPFGMYSDSQTQSRTAPTESPEMLGELPDGRFSAMANGNLVLVVLFAAGVLGVYLLSLQGGPAVASAEDMKNQVRVDTALKQLKIVNQHGKRGTLDTFYYEARQRQIPLKELKDNPFVYVPPKPAAVTPGSAKMRAAIAAQRARTLQQAGEAMKALKSLQLESVLSGSSGSIAMISGDLVVRGQKIKGWTVERIEPRQVMLSWQGHEHTLKLP